LSLPPPGARGFRGGMSGSGEVRGSGESGMAGWGIRGGGRGGGGGGASLGF
jgi:hypothetical protein